MRKFALLAVAVLVLSFSLFARVPFAGSEDDRHHGQEHDERGMGLVADPAHADACGGCHFAYPPWLLPARSWEQILAGSDDHYGNALSFSDEERRGLVQYLTANAADRSGFKRARKIMRDVGGGTPLRVTEVPYLLHKHHELDAAVFSRSAVGGFGNCPACHATAAEGDFDDDNVSIPR